MSDRIAASAPLQRGRHRSSRPARHRAADATAPSTHLRRHRLHWLTSWTWRRAFVVLIAMAGVSLFLYPTAMDWFHARTHAATAKAYAEAVAPMPAAKVQAELRKAHEYNRHLPARPDTDPFAGQSDSGSERAAAPSAPLSPEDVQAVRTYNDVLDVGPDGMMGMLNAPSINLSLPVYHGTADDTLRRGIGHLYGTAVPVGGQGTHAVLSGHSGIPGDTLFSHLHELKLGDSFTVDVLNEVLTYRVDHIDTVLPEDASLLAPVPGKDYLTLVTCTPIGVNSHRLLVRGVRVPTPGNASAISAIGSAPGPGLPWWALVGGGCLLGCIVLTTPLARRSRDAP